MALIAREIADSVDVSMRVFNHRLNSRVNRGCLADAFPLGEHSAIMTHDLSIVGARIKERLKDLDQTQGDLAEGLNVSDNAVSKWIKTGKISRENAIRAAEYLRTTVEWLTGKEDRLPAKAIHVALDWNTLDEPLRSQIADVIHREADAVRARERPKDPPEASRPIAFPQAAEGRAMIEASQAPWRPYLLWIAAVAYAQVPIFSGAWFNDSIECVYMTREALRSGFSMLGFLALPLWVACVAIPGYRDRDGYAIALILIATMSLLTGANVVAKCW